MNKDLIGPLLLALALTFIMGMSLGVKLHRTYGPICEEAAS